MKKENITELFVDHFAEGGKMVEMNVLAKGNKPIFYIFAR
jgi:hypothetical protein